MILTPIHVTGSWVGNAACLLPVAVHTSSLLLGSRQRIRSVPRRSPVVRSSLFTFGDALVGIVGGYREVLDPCQSVLAWL